MTPTRSRECSGDVIWPVYRKYESFDLAPLLNVVKSWSVYQKNRIDSLLWLNAFIFRYDMILAISSKKSFFVHLTSLFVETFCYSTYRYLRSRACWNVPTVFFFYRFKLFYTAFWKFRSPSNPSLWPYCFSISSMTRPDKWKRIVA